MQDIHIFTSPSCPHCHSIKSWMTDHDIPYIEFDISKPENEYHIKEMQKEGILELPGIQFDGVWISEKELRELFL